MKKILLFAFLLCSFSAFAQYPAQPTTKQELGRQTTGDGLIYRGSGAPAYTPVNNRNAWIYYDTTNNRLYKSRLGSWSLMIQDTSAFNEIQMPYIVDDTLYLTQNVTGEPLTAYVNRVWPIAALSDTASITGENQGDVAFVTGGTAVAFRGSAYWNPFSGGGGGGTVTGTGTTGTIPVWSSSSALGDSPLTVSSGSVIAGGTGFFRFPVGTTAQRPGTPQSGDARYNTTNGVMEWYGASAWEVPVESASATGMGTANLVSAFDANGRLGDSRYRQNFVADWNTVSDKEIAILNWAGTGAPVDGSGASGINIPHTSSTFGWQLASSSNADALYYRRKQAGTWQSWVRIDNTLSVQSTSGVLGFLPVYDGTITGLTASRFKNTIGTTFNINETNFQFIGYTGTDAPAGGGGAYGAYFPHQSSALYGWQLAADAGGNRFYFRNKDAGTWQSWRRVTTGTLTTGTVGNVAIWGAVGELSENASFFWDTANTRLGIGTNTPARSLDAGEVRVRDLTTDTPTRIVGADADGDLGAITVGYGLTFASGALRADTSSANSLVTQSDLAVVAASVAAIPTPRYGKFSGTTDVNGLISITLSGTPATGACTCTNNETISASFRYIFSANHTSGTNVDVRVYDADTMGMLSFTSVNFSIICY